MNETIVAKDMKAKRKAREMAKKRLLVLNDFAKLEGSDDREIGTEWFAYDRRNDRIAVTLLRPLSRDEFENKSGDDRSDLFEIDGTLYVLTFFGRLPTDKHITVRSAAVEMVGGSFKIETPGMIGYFETLEQAENAIRQNVV